MVDGISRVAIYKHELKADDFDGFVGNKMGKAVRENPSISIELISLFIRFYDFITHLRKSIQNIT